MVIAEDQRRCFVLTVGRTGSTLLATILADAGADFGLQTPTKWDPGSGQMEHTELRRAATWMRYAYQISADRPPIGIRRYLWDIFRSLGKRHVKRLVSQARFIKGEDADFLVNPAFRMGYLPSIVISYRRFEDYAASTATMRGHSMLPTLASYYNRVNRNALLWLSVFGGCVVGHRELSDPDDTSWANPLAEVTGLAPGRLIEARRQRLGRGSPPVEVPCLDTDAAWIFETIDALRGRVIPPGAQSQRSWRRSHGTDPAATPVATARAAPAATATTNKAR
jgi:hypothetical protein